RPAPGGGARADGHRRGPGGRRGGRAQQRGHGGRGTGSGGRHRFVRAFAAPREAVRDPGAVSAVEPGMKKRSMLAIASLATGFVVAAVTPSHALGDSLGGIDVEDTLSTL